MKLITFDFEGTLVDHQWKVKDAQSETIRWLSEKGIPSETFEGMNYATIYNLVREKEVQWGFAQNDLISYIDKIYDGYDMDAASRYQPVQGLPQLFFLLQSCKTALISNSGKKGVQQALSKFNLQNSFGLVLTRNDVRLLKPSGEGIQEALEWAGVKKEDAIHIGDSLADIDAARDAGIKVGIVLGGQNKAEALIKEKPDLVLEHLPDLPDALRSIHF